MTLEVSHSVIQTSQGDFHCYFTQTGLARLFFPEAKLDFRPRPGIDLSPNCAHEWIHLTEQCIQRLMSGKPPSQMPPFDLDGHGAFECSVWEQLLAIPWGTTKSYGEIAENLGSIGHSRAVGTACGRNPIPLLIPCHRVIASNGNLGGFSGPKGWKEKLLKLERVLL